MPASMLETARWSPPRARATSGLCKGRSLLIGMLDFVRHLPRTFLGGTQNEELSNAGGAIEPSARTYWRQWPKASFHPLLRRRGYSNSPL